ncbi:XRE family transcriptional regulator [Companilactobacillus suantsaicola]|uniref:XRE family transcriptional regulator n=1 Tax=Companilactobacillus suantsaicola TaxID=2487723 RepID=A0A4Z0JRD4_9LACO|nr:helix-turn-helix transcriptional regulator [Companilactobacillus suantsaicola]TGD24475.1 XRE family transcriptional regulator [Companilactobacillus suantsaicola]
MGVLFLFLGSIIYNKRREMNLTQIELANDICTQNTISKIEKHNIAPTVNILIKICLKLDLTLNDVFSDFADKKTDAKESLLDAIEKEVLLNQLIGIDEKLSNLQGKLGDDDKKQYELITGALNYYNGSNDESLFTLDKVLQLTKSANDDIYTLLAYLFKGLNYLSQNHLDRAQYYFQMIGDVVEENIDVINANDLEGLFICKTLSESFNGMRLFQNAYQFAHFGLNYAKENHSTYYLAELYFNAALALKDSPDREEQYHDYSRLAYYLAKSDQNETLLEKISRME